MDPNKFDHCDECGLLWLARKLAMPFGDGMKYCPKCHEEVAKRLLKRVYEFTKRSD